jgi:hypothetical protein
MKPTKENNMSEIFYRAEIRTLAVFSLDNNPNANLGYPLGGGVLLGQLPWADNESLTSALDCWASAETTARILGGGKIGLAARIGGIWFHIDASHISRWVA